MELRFCATPCAAPTAALCAEYELGLVDSVCNALVKLSKMASNDDRGSRRAVNLLQLLIELRGRVGVGAAGRLGPQLALQQCIEIAVDAGDVDARRRPDR